MLLLLPPSECKAPTPRNGRPLDLARLSFPGLTATRATVLDALGDAVRGRSRRDHVTRRTGA